MKKLLIIISLISMIFVSSCNDKDVIQNEKNDAELASNISIDTADIEKNTYVSEYSKIVNETYKNSSEYRDMKYSLMYFNNDDIPDLLVDCSGYFNSLYVYSAGKLHTVVDNWPYGAAGNAGYTFEKGSISNWNSDYSGLVVTNSISVLNKNMKFDEFWYRGTGAEPDNLEDPEYLKIIEEESPYFGYYRNGEKFSNKDEYDVALKKCLEENNYSGKQLEYIVRDVSKEEIILELNKLLDN